MENMLLIGKPHRGTIYRAPMGWCVGDLGCGWDGAWDERERVSSEVDADSWGGLFPAGRLFHHHMRRVSAGYFWSSGRGQSGFVSIGRNCTELLGSDPRTLPNSHHKRICDHAKPSAWNYCFGCRGTIHRALRSGGTNQRTVPKTNARHDSDDRQDVQSRSYPEREKQSRDR
jgi:hypothetical protein